MILMQSLSAHAYLQLW